MLDVNKTFAKYVNMSLCFVYTAQIIKDGFDFKKTISDETSPTGRLIDYNIRILTHNIATAFLTAQAVQVLFYIVRGGANPVTIVAHLCLIALFKVVREQMQIELNGFLIERATVVVVEKGVATVNVVAKGAAKFINGTAKILNTLAGNEHQDVITPQDVIDPNIPFTAGKDCGPMGLFKTVTPLNEVVNKIGFEMAWNNRNPDELFANRPRGRGAD